MIFSIIGVIIFSVLLSVCPAAAAIGAVTPMLTLGTEYTDNVFQDKEDPKDDFIYTVSPGFSFQLTGKRSDASLSYNPEYRLYSEYKERSFWRHSALLLGKVGLYKNTTLNFQDSFLRTEDRLQEDNLIILKNQEPYNRNRAGIWLAHQFGRRDSVTVRYDYNILRNGNINIQESNTAIGNIQNLEDNSTYSPSLRLICWMVPGQWGLETGGSYTRGQYDSELENPSDDFDNFKGDVKLLKQFGRRLTGFIRYAHTEMIYDGDTENYQVVNPSIGINYVFEDDAVLLLSAGYLLQVREVSDEESSPVAEMNFQKVWELRRTSITVNALSGYTESNMEGQNFGFTVFYRGAVRVEYAFLKTFSGDLYGSYQLNDYINFEPEREDRNLIAGLGLSYRITSWVSSRIDYSVRDLDSTIDLSDFTENRILFNVSVSPPRPYRIF